MKCVMLLFILTSVAAAQDANALVNKALKATGWDQRKSDHATWKDSGTFTFAGQKMPYRGEFHLTYPDKYRFAMTMKTGNDDFAFTVVLNGVQAWESAGGKVEPMKAEKLTYLQNELHMMNVLSLRPLVDAKAGFKLEAIAEETINGAKCPGIVAKKEGKPDIRIWFDAAGLPAKLSYVVKNEFDNWKDATDEVYLSDWADDAGIKNFKKMKLNRNGQLMIESECSGYQTPERVDPKLYEKP